MLPMLLVHMTATYSNAVLVASLPYVNDFAKKMDLPIPLPITTNQISSTKIWPVAGNPQGVFILTNGFRFITFSQGYVNEFSTPKNFIHNKPDDWWSNNEGLKKWVGPVNMTTNQAIEMGRETIKKLGYKLEWFDASKPPEHFETYPLTVGVIPQCRMRWESEENKVEIDVDMERKNVVGLSVSFGNYFLATTKEMKLTPIKTDVEPLLEVDLEIQKNPDVVPRKLHNLVHMTPAYSNAVFTIALTQVNDFAKKLDLPISLPVTTNHLRWTDISPYLIGIIAKLELTNRMTFLTDGRCCFGLETEEAYFPRGENVDEYETDESLSRWVGPMNITTNQAIEMAREAMKKLGYKLEDFGATNPPTEFDFPTKCRKGIIPYCKATWGINDGNQAQFSINMKDKTFVRIDIEYTPAFEKAHNLTPIKPDVVPEMEFNFRKQMLQQKGLLPKINPSNN